MPSRIRNISYSLPERIVTSTEIENRLQEENPHIRITQGFIETISGVKTRRIASETEYSSTVAVRAAEKLFVNNEIDRSDIDLLIFASATQDLIEPATAHIIQERLGTRCPVFDIKNACNSFLNGLQVAQSLIESGQYSRILITTGEVTSRAIKWKLTDRDDLKRSFAGYTMGDAGAAALVERSDSKETLFSKFDADSTAWSYGTLPAGGTRHPRGDEYSYFQGDGNALHQAFFQLAPQFFSRHKDELLPFLMESRMVFMHQVSTAYTKNFCDGIGLEENKVFSTITNYGNIAAATLPLGIALAIEKGTLDRGDTITLIGLAGGISLGVTSLRW